MRALVPRDAGSGIVLIFFHGLTGSSTHHGRVSALTTGSAFARESFSVEPCLASISISPALRNSTYSFGFSRTTFLATSALGQTGGGSNFVEPPPVWPNVRARVLRLLPSSHFRLSGHLRSALKRSVSIARLRTSACRTLQISHAGAMLHPQREPSPRWAVAPGWASFRK